MYNFACEYVFSIVLGRYLGVKVLYINSTFNFLRFCFARQLRNFPFLLALYEDSNGPSDHQQNHSEFSPLVSVVHSYFHSDGVSVGLNSDYTPSGRVASIKTHLYRRHQQDFPLLPLHRPQGLPWE